jgi:hypothetical protein
MNPPYDELNRRVVQIMANAKSFYATPSSLRREGTPEVVAVVLGENMVNLDIHVCYTETFEEAYITADLLQKMAVKLVEDGEQQFAVPI